jgi:hypothetical protein
VSARCSSNSRRPRKAQFHRAGQFAFQA